MRLWTHRLIVNDKTQFELLKEIEELAFVDGFTAGSRRAGKEPTKDEIKTALSIFISDRDL